MAAGDIVEGADSVCSEIGVDSMGGGGGTGFDMARRLKKICRLERELAWGGDYRRFGECGMKL